MVVSSTCSPFAANHMVPDCLCRPQHQLLAPSPKRGSNAPIGATGRGSWISGATMTPSLHHTGGDVATIARHYAVCSSLKAVLASARQCVIREPVFPRPCMAKNVAAQNVAVYMRGKKAATYSSKLSARLLSPRPTCNVSVPGGAATRAAENKHTPYDFLLV